MSLKLTDCYSINNKFWKIFGVHPNIHSNIYMWYSRIVLFVFIYFHDMVNTVNFYFLPSDLDLFIEEAIFYFTELSIMSRVLTFGFNRESISKLLTVLDSDHFQPDTEKGLEIITGAMNFNVKYWKILAYMSYFSHGVHILSPLIAHFGFSVPLYLPLCSYSFLTDSTKETYIYPLYIYQCLGMQWHMQCGVNIDSFLVGLMIFVIAQLEVLEHKLVTLADVPKISKTGKRNSSSIDEIQFVKKLNTYIVQYTNICK